METNQPLRSFKFYNQPLKIIKVEREYFLRTQRLKFSKWTNSDKEMASLVWGEADVTKYICSSGLFSNDEITARLNTEITNDRLYGVSYWPIFTISGNDFIGCCGIRPFKGEKDTFELGFHLRRAFWNKGYATEAATAVIDYCFKSLHAAKLYAGHHPKNTASGKVLIKLGFTYIGDKFYEPTGLFHPSYELLNTEKADI